MKSARVKRMRRLIGALGLSWALGAQTLPTEQLNQVLPEWLRLNMEYRVRVEGFEGGGFRLNNEDEYELSRLRMNATVRPLSWMKFQFQGQDSWSPNRNQQPHGPPLEDRMDLRVGFLELGDMEKGKVAVRAGRQSITMGEGRLIGDPNYSNTGRTFDAVRATLRDPALGLRADLFAASVVKLQAGAFDRSEPGDNLHGIYGGLEKLVPKAVVEPYLYWRVGPRQRAETGPLGVLDFWVNGLRWVGKLPHNHDYNIELISEHGSLGPDVIHAWAAHGLIGRTFPKGPWKPRVFVEYNFASGDRNPSDGVRGTFDQLYPAAHDKLGFADQIGWRNIHHGRLTGELKPVKKLAVSTGYHQYWLASPKDGLYATNSSLAVRAPSGNTAKHVGQEIDVTGVYTINKMFVVGAGFARLFPGEFLKKATEGRSYSYPFISLTTFF